MVTPKKGDVAPKLRGNAGKGRPKGATNKLTTTIKEAIEKSFDIVGGPAYLAQMAIEQPQAYMTLLGKVLPTQVKADVTVTPGYHFEIEEVKPNA